METKPKRSRALIITIIIVLLLLLVGYLIFKNVKNTSSTNFISKIFSSLSPSSNNKTEEVQAGEDIGKGDNVSKAGTASDGSSVVVKARNGANILGVANEDIENGGFGEITISGSASNNFLNSFSGFLDDLFGGNSGENGGLGTGGGEITTGGGEIGGGTGGEITTISECNDETDNDNDTKVDALDPECHLDGDISKEYLPSHNSESSSTTTGGDKTIPDLTSSSVSPTSTTINTLTTITSLISNSGESSTVKSFYSFFTITNITRDDTQQEIQTPTVSKSKLKTFISKVVTKIPWVSSKKTIAEESIEMNTLIAPLQGESTTIASIFYTFDQAGTYYIRACADKSSASDLGVIDESNENNNCGPWATFTVSDSLPTGGEITTEDDDITTGDDIGDDTIIEIGEDNKCLLIEQNPLEFTNEEKARLEILLRKFYLISSTLRTSDDIVTIYDEMDRYKDFMSQTDILTKQCYLDTNDVSGYSDFCLRNPSLCSSSDKFNSSYNNPGTIKHGNPWYTKTSGGSFPYTDTEFGYTNYNWIQAEGPGCKVVTGYYYGTWTDKNGKIFDCDSLNDPNDYNCSGSIKTNMTGGNSGPDQGKLDMGCKWKEGVYMEDTERILNIW